MLHTLTTYMNRHLLLTFSLAIFLGAPSFNQALAIASNPDVVDHVTIHSQGDGVVASYTLPIYQIGDIRFISAGVGLEERKASYPQYSLKLVFAQAGGAFLSGVSVTIQDKSGNEIVGISGDQVTGPWLFVDLKTGTYQVTAVRSDGTAVKRTVHVQKGRTKGVLLHWPMPKTHG